MFICTTRRNKLYLIATFRLLYQTGECMYKIPCHNCSSTCTYIVHWRNRQSYGNREEEHRKEVESIGNRTLTRTDRKDLSAETNKSTITDHVAKEKHVINWSTAEILDRESHRKTRQLKESICVHKRSTV